MGQQLTTPRGVGTLAISGAEGIAGVNGEYFALHELINERVAYRKKPDYEGAPSPHVYVYYSYPFWCISNFLGQSSLFDMYWLLVNHDKEATSPEKVTQKWRAPGKSGEVDVQMVRCSPKCVVESSVSDSYEHARRMFA